MWRRKMCKKRPWDITTKHNGGQDSKSATDDGKVEPRGLFSPRKPPPLLLAVMELQQEE